MYTPIRVSTANIEISEKQKDLQNGKNNRH